MLTSGLALKSTSSLHHSIIHPSIHFPPLIQSQVTVTPLTPATLSSSSQGNPEAFPGQMKYVVSPACSGSTPGASCWSNLPRKCPVGAPQVPHPYDQSLTPGIHPCLHCTTRPSLANSPPRFGSSRGLWFPWSRRVDTFLNMAVHCS